MPFLRTLFVMLGLLAATISKAQASNMILEFDTNLGDGTTIQLPLYGTVNIQVDWGDGSAVESFTSSGLVSHTYAQEGVYTVNLLGTLYGFGGYTQNYNPVMLKRVLSFGGLGIKSLEFAFYNAKNLVEVPSELPSTVTSLAGTFLGAKAFNQSLSDWNVANVTKMFYMFYGATAFNQPLNTWNVANVTNMSAMFYDASSFNQPLNAWNVANVADMAAMFYNASSFNQPLSTWNVANVTNMSFMFSGAAAFNQPLNNWDVANVTNMSSMFYNASSFNQPLSSWNVANVANMGAMFYNASSFNQDLSTWNVSNVTNMGAMFYGASSFNQDLSTWNVSNVTNMASMFLGASSFNQDLSTWNVSNVTNMGTMFYNAKSFNQPLNTWNVGNVTNMAAMFYGANSFNQPLNTWNVSSVTNMQTMFVYASSFNQPLNTWNVSNVTNMAYMFFGASSFNQDLSSWKVGNVTQMTGLLNNTLFSTSNYDALLNAWSQLNLKSNVRLDAPNVYYSPAAASARQAIITNYAWTIYDKGLEPQAPVVSSVSVPANGTYRLGQNLNFVVNFDQNVVVNTNGGVPYINITLETGGVVQASYVSGSNTSSLTFRYTIQSSQQDLDGITLGASINLNGATIRNASNLNATLTLNSVGSTQGIIILGPQTIYVNKNQNSGSNNGRSWSNAYTDLQSALLSSIAGDEIWVAAGTYYPSSTNDRTSFFNIPSGVKVYGGFSGTETVLTGRNSKLNKTVLSGDIGVSGNISDNSQNIVRFIGASTSTILDGFTITKANGVNGGAIYTERGSPRVTNCIIESNMVSNVGGAIYNGSYLSAIASPVFTNCVFNDNKAPRGAVIFNDTYTSGRAYPEFINCVIINNEATLDGIGGDIIHSNSVTSSISLLRVINCTAINNTVKPGRFFSGWSFTGGASATYQSLNLLRWRNTSDGPGLYDPLFVDINDPDGPDNIWMTADDGLRLTDCSPLINFGVNTGAPSLDILGNPIGSSIKDLGAYESSSIGTPVIGTPNNMSEQLFEGQSTAITGLTSGGTWQSSDPNLATIDANGNIQLLRAGQVTFTYTLTNSTGCENTVQKHINILAKPKLKVQEICDNTSISLETDIAAVSSITWYKGNQALTTNLKSDYLDIRTVAGGNGLGSAANQLLNHGTIAIDKDSTIYIADWGNHRVQKWLRGATSGITVAGNAVQGSAANQLNTPQGLFLSKTGDLFIADGLNHRIQKWTKDPTSPTGFSARGITVAGGNGPGSSLSQLNNPQGVSLDIYGNLIIADTYNHRVMRWVPGASSGEVIAGGNGQGSTASQLNFPNSAMLDINQQLYIADRLNHRIQRWDRSTKGTSGYTFSGLTVAGGNGPGSSANQLASPLVAYVNNYGDLYIVELANHRIQRWDRLTNAGITVAGGNGIGNAPNQLNGPQDIQFMDDGSMYISDVFNARIQKISISSAFKTYSATSAGNYWAEIRFDNGLIQTTEPIVIELVKPAIAYAFESINLLKNAPMNDIVPQITPGSNPNITYGINPSLPVGLQFDPQTAVISGTLAVNLTGSQEFTITATNCIGTSSTKLTLIYNRAPVDISINRTQIYEKNAADITIATLSTTDPDAGDSHTYTLVAGDLSVFTLSGNQLKASATFNYNAQNSYRILLRTTDAGNLSFEKTITITILPAPIITGTGNYPGSLQPTAPSTSPSISKGYSSQLNVSGAGIINYSWTPAAGLSTTNTANPVATPSQNTTYTVTVTHSSGATISLPITVSVYTDYNITPNNLLTPNGDGQNDTWVIENIETYPNNEVRVYDKSGRLVFSKRSYTNDWNAQLGGITLATDTYYYIITFGQDIPAKKGFITIVNNN